jgi:hypothetical protein
MGSGFFTGQTTSTPFMNDSIAALLGGAVWCGSGYPEPVTTSAPSGGAPKWGLNATAQLKALPLEMPTSGDEYQYDNDRVTNPTAANFTDFGVLYSAAMANYGGSTREAAYVTGGGDDGSVQYVKGPFWRAAERVSYIWDQTHFGNGDDVSDDVSPQDSYFRPGTRLAGQGYNVFPTINAVSDIDDLIEKYKATAIPTTVWFAGANSEWDTILEKLEDDLTIPTVTATAMAFTDIDPLGSHTFVDIDAPATVGVADGIDAAVEAYSALAETRFAADEARLRASLFSTRSMMSTAFDGAIAILTMSKTAQISDYDKSLRLKQAELQAQADLEHQRNLLEQRTRNQQIRLDAFRANVESGAKEAEINLMGARAAADSGARLDEVTASIYASVVNARAATLGTIFSFVASNSGASASLINGWVDANLRRDVSAVAAHIDEWKTHYEIRERVSNAQAALAELRWKAQIQRLMVLKEAISAFTPGMGGTVENHPSGFQNLQNGIGMGAGLISSGIQGVLALMG